MTLRAARRFDAVAAAVGATRRARRRRRGSLYLTVLLTAALVVVLGFSGIAAARIRLREARGQNAAMHARTCALSGVEMALHALAADPNWRTTYNHDTWTARQAAGAGKFRWKLVDETNSDLAVDPTGPVRLYAQGTCDDSVRTFSVLLEADPESLAYNLVADADVENGGKGWSGLGLCTVSASTSSPHGGALCLLASARPIAATGPAADISGGLKSGTTYRVEAWVRCAKLLDFFRLALSYKTDAGESNTLYISGSAAVGTSWAKVSGTFTPTWTGNLTQAYFIVQTQIFANDIFVDDVSFEGEGLVPKMVIVPGTWRTEVDQ